ncbi:T9SS type A sorting domain-containing protein [Flammeovirga pectinis]|uniref:T9SS type A sorting domain-containing protein n=1 Tax=Flammeovirga pectinis TaxID=2494373 RepID=UPI00197AC96E|nr:T9SS type A sorting domain-containing protein [Flammeovirga pectinis]
MSSIFIDVKATSNSLLSDTLSGPIVSTVLESNTLFVEVLEAGDYNLSVEVFLTSENTLNKFYFQFLSPWVSVPFTIDGIEKGKWVTLSEKVTIKERLEEGNARFHIPLKNDDEVIADIYFGTIQLEKVSDVTDISKNWNKIKVYPNPAEDVINVRGEGIESVFIYNVQGQLMREILSDFERIPIPSFRKGVYILRIQMTDKSFQNKKIIVN